MFLKFLSPLAASAQMNTFSTSGSKIIFSQYRVYGIKRRTSRILSRFQKYKFVLVGKMHLKKLFENKHVKFGLHFHRKKRQLS
jgi:hypothetical protein